MNNMGNKKFVTNAYILNKNEIYGNCNQLYNKNLYVKSKKNDTKKNDIENCEPKIYYNCPMPNYIKCWDEKKVNKENRNDLVLSNIQNGGVICDFKPRTNINTKISSRFLTNFAIPPCDYVDAIETEFYLIHGDKSGCSKYLNR